MKRRDFIERMGKVLAESRGTGTPILSPADKKRNDIHVVWGESIWESTAADAEGLPEIFWDSGGKHATMLEALRETVGDEECLRRALKILEEEE